MQNPLTGSVILRVEITGPRQTHRFDLLLDTGAAVVTIGRLAAESLGFDLEDPTATLPLTTASGTIDAPVFHAREIRVEEVVAQNVTLCVHDLPSDLPLDIDGLLGMSFLEHTIFTFDFKAKAFTMVDP